MSRVAGQDDTPSKCANRMRQGSVMNRNLIVRMFVLSVGCVLGPALIGSTVIGSIFIGVLVPVRSAFGQGAIDQAAGQAGADAEAATAKGMWKAGLAKAIITPRDAVWLAGYGSKRVPEGKIHDLWIKGIAIEDHQGRRGVLLTSDFQGVPRSMSDRVFARLKADYGLDRHQVMFTFSHNHCGPRLGDDLVDYYPIEAEQVELVRKYTLEMETLVVRLVGEAIANLAPAELAMGEGKTTFAVNRRDNVEADVPRMLADGVRL